MVTRQQMGKIIFDFEAEYDGRGNLRVYYLDKVGNDGGGAFEVAGVDVADHPSEAHELAELVNEGRYSDAEARAIEFILDYTNPVAGWTSTPWLELFLRDSYFNRGPRGSGEILQIALGGLVLDGAVGPKTLAALAGQEGNGRRLLDKLRQAREAYELTEKGFRANLWPGLVNRWNELTRICSIFCNA